MGGDSISADLQPYPVDGSGEGDMVGDLDWLEDYPYDSSQQALFWTEWANELDMLGT